MRCRLPAEVPSFLFFSEPARCFGSFQSVNFVAMRPTLPVRILSWPEAFACGESWIPGFVLEAPARPRDFGFDAVAAWMVRQPGGMIPMGKGIPENEDLFVEECLRHFSVRPGEVVVIPDCGDVSKVPVRLSVEWLNTGRAAGPPVCLMALRIRCSCLITAAWCCWTTMNGSGGAAAGHSNKLILLKSYRK